MVVNSVDCAGCDGLVGMVVNLVDCAGAVVDSVGCAGSVGCCGVVVGGGNGVDGTVDLLH